MYSVLHQIRPNILITPSVKAHFDLKTQGGGVQGSAQTCKVRGGGAGMQLGTGENRVGDLMPYACG